MSIYDYLKRNNKEVQFVDRSGTIISVYCKGNIKIQFQYNTISTASRKLTQFRRELENKRVG